MSSTIALNSSYALDVSVLSSKSPRGEPRARRSSPFPPRGPYARYHRGRACAARAAPRRDAPCRPSLTLHDAHEVAHERPHIADRPDRPRVVHPRRPKDPNEPDHIAVRAVTTDDQAAVAQRLVPVLTADRDVDLPCAEVERQDLGQTRVVLEEAEHLAAAISLRELGLGKDVLESVHVELARAEGVLLFQDADEGPDHVGVRALLAANVMLHRCGVRA